MVSLSSGLLQFVSNAYLITPNSNGTSASIDQNHMQLLSLVNQRQAKLIGDNRPFYCRLRAACRGYVRAIRADSGNARLRHIE